MRPVFADTSFYLALLLPTDEDHTRALGFTEFLSVSVVTTAWIITEVGNSLASPRNRHLFVGLIRALQAEQDVTIVPPSPTLYDKGIDLYTRRADKGWSMTDCISFVVMEEMGIRDALTADHHFEQAGFRALMLES